MDIKEYAEQVARRVEAKLPSNKYKVRVNEVCKNNGIKFNSITIIEGGNNIAPNIYIDEYYYHNCNIEEIADKVIEIYNNTELDINFKLDEFMDYTKVKESIRFKVVNTIKNKELIKKCPHKNILDLTVLCYYHINDVNNKGCKSIMITNDLINKWNITEHQLFQDTKSNKDVINDFCIIDMKEILLSFGVDISEEMGTISHDDTMPMIVLSNKANLFGASNIVNKKALNACAEKLNSNFYILPSSIHELIIVSDKDTPDCDCLTKMVIEVNNSDNITDEEILSNTVYYYDASKQVLTIK